VRTKVTLQYIPGFRGQHTVEVRTHSRGHVCRVTARGDERNIHGKVQLTTTLQNLLDGFVNRGTLAARIFQGSLEGLIIGMNVNPRVADVISDGKKRKKQSLSFERVNVIRRVQPIIPGLYSLPIFEKNPAPPAFRSIAKQGDNAVPLRPPREAI